MSKWTLFSNHGHVLVVLSRDPDARLRDVAQIVGITERRVQKIVRDLQDGGLVSVTKQGRRNRYRLHRNQPLRHTLEAHCTTGELLEMVNRRAPGMLPPEASEAPMRAVPPGPTPTPTAFPTEAASTQGGRPDTTSASGSVETVIESHPEKELAADVRPDEAARKKPARKPVTPADDGDQGSLF